MKIIVPVEAERSKDYSQKEKHKAHLKLLFRYLSPALLVYSVLYLEY